MRRPLIVALLIGIVACAEDHYTVIPNGPGSEAKMSGDLKECKRIAVHAYSEGRFNGGSAVGGAIGGALGGAIGGLLDASTTTNDMKPSDINRMTEQCMKSRGYIGTSSH